VKKNAKDLNKTEKNFLLDKLFNINIEKVVFRSKRYKELYEKKEYLLNLGKSDLAEEFFEQEIRDLQVHFQLGWSGTELKNNKFIKELIKKDRDFTEEEKNELLSIQDEFLIKVSDYIKGLTDNEKVEVSLTPFYHPIIPIMNDIIMLIRLGLIPLLRIIFRI
jgi:alpha-amylase/alpha-mannosidase (GH57 family)